MADVEKVARAIPDEAVAAFTTKYREIAKRDNWGSSWPAEDRVRELLAAAIAAMGEREAVAWRYRSNDKAVWNYAEGGPPRGVGAEIVQPLYASPRPEAVEDAVKAERERCARIAEADRRGELAKQCGYEPAFHTVGKVIAAAIRATEGSKG